MDCDSGGRDAFGERGILRWGDPLKFGNFEWELSSDVDDEWIDCGDA
jgi:hypothetical protein